MITRRDFCQATVATASLLAASGHSSLAKAAIHQKISQEDLLRFPSAGKLTLLHVADLHAQLMPVYFREPSVNIGTGQGRKIPPHIVEAELRAAFGVAAGSPEAYALSSEDFVALARAYGRMGGFDRLATLVAEIRADRGNANVLLLDGGDTWQGSWTANETKGQDMVTAMSALGVDAMVGHWEFTLGAQRVQQIVAETSVAFLAQNIRETEWDEPVFPARKLFDRGGARVAVIGQAFPRTPISNPRWMIPAWEFGLREDALQTQVDEAKVEGADVVVLLSHNGFDVDRKLASRVRGLDVILCAHTHDALPAVTEVGQTLLVASGSHGKFLSRLDLDIRDRRVVGRAYRLIPIFSDVITPHEKVQSLVQNLRAPYAPALERVLGTTDELLYRRGNFNGTMDDLLCQAILKERDVEIALSPGFRWGASLLPGDKITFEALTNATAMSYPACYRVEMTGTQIKALLEDVADNIFNPDPFFQGGGDMVRTGGLSYTINVGEAMGKRISDLTHTASGQPLDASRSYTVGGWASINPQVEGPPIWTIAEQFIQKTGTVAIMPANNVRVLGA